VIEDRTEQDAINLRRTIFLTIMSSLDVEEAAHKLAKIEINDTQLVGGGGERHSRATPLTPPPPTPPFPPRRD
jgi:hypothetical protein